MSGPILQFLAADHQRLDTLLARAVATPGTVDMEPFAEFRQGLLKHIGWEEKILLPAAKQAAGAPVAGADRLRADHGKFVAMLVPTPTPASVAQLQALLAAHNALEEDPGGVYETCEQLLAREAELIIERFRATPDVPVRPHMDARVPRILKS